MNHEIHERRGKIIFKEENYALQGAIFEVYKKMGSGFLEAVYQECLEKEFDLRKNGKLNIHKFFREFRGKSIYM